MNPKVIKLREEREKNSEKIASLQARNKKIDADIIAIENTDIIGMVRELLGTGCIFGYSLIGGADGMLMMILPPGGFLALGFLMALVNHLRKRSVKKS